MERRPLWRLRGAVCASRALWQVSALAESSPGILRRLAGLLWQRPPYDGGGDVVFQPITQHSEYALKPMYSKTYTQRMPLKHLHSEIQKKCTQNLTLKVWHSKECILKPKTLRMTLKGDSRIMRQFGVPVTSKVTWRLFRAFFIFNFFLLFMSSTKTNRKKGPRCLTLNGRSTCTPKVNSVTVPKTHTSTFEAIWWNKRDEINLCSGWKGNFRDWSDDC